MKLLGITAEYDPFHNGHAYHIREAKLRSGCDSLVVLMSGDFTQRGTPAIMDKYVRAEAALRNGADIVIELPVYSATASAEGFAEGAMRAFSDLGVDCISYGVECGEKPEETVAQIREAASFFAEEPEEFRTLLKEALAEGMSYPVARHSAYRKLTGEDGAFLSSPNNILAIEYEKAMLRLKASFTSVPIARAGKGYHDPSPSELASATAIRKLIIEDSSLSETVPMNLLSLYEEPAKHPVTADDLSGALFSALHGRSWQELAEFSDVSADTAKRLTEASKKPFTWTSLTEDLRERSHTLTHVNRALCHILLNITKDDEQRYRAAAHVPYLHVLGIRKEAAPLLGQLADRSPAPLLVRLGKDMKTLPEDASRLFDRELAATALFSHILYGKGVATTEERVRKFMIVS